MTDSRFFKSEGPFTLKEIAEKIGAELSEGADDVLISDVSALCDAGKGHLSFFDNKKYLPDFEKTEASACITYPENADKAPDGLHLLLTPMPYLAYAQAATLFYPAPRSNGQISKAAILDPTAKIGQNVQIEAGAVIEAGAEIGDDCVIKSNTVIAENVLIGSGSIIDANVFITHAIIGSGVRIFPGVKIGQAGFGFAFGPKGFEDIPQLGRVLIGDRVLIGANTTIDRGANTDTVIGDGTMIDNLVQIGHNVKVGKMCVIVAQCGIAGSTIVEDYVMMGGQCGINGHIRIGLGAKIAARSAVARDIPAGQEYIGSPAVPKKEFGRQMMALSRLFRQQKKK